MEKRQVGEPLAKMTIKTEGVVDWLENLPVAEWERLTGLVDRTTWFGIDEER